MSQRPDKEEATSLQHEAEHQTPRKAPSVIPYLAMLVAAAFLLLVMAYLMQQRTAESVEGLSQSVNTIQSFDQLVDENQSLRQEVQDLKGQLEQATDRQLALESQLRVAEAKLAELQTQLDALQPSPEPSPSPAP